MKTAITALLAAAFVVAAAGCGGSSGSSSGTTTSGGGGSTTTSSSGSGGSASGKLVGTVGPGYTITLTKGGQPVTSLPAGTYTFVITDKASIHGFTLEQEEGGSFEQDLTSVPDQETTTTKVKLTKGEWKFYCPPHESQMNGSFDVT
ncbi:MAG TPA: hypothetical protein VH297_03525 [Gaiellaceae bacterium]|jgi:plastocyanin